MASISNSTSSICGISIGTENCYVAVARQGGIEILLNEYSQRSTPAYIGFGGNQRELGVSAKQKQMMNLSNTCFAPTKIIGKKYHQVNPQDFPFKIEPGPDDEILVRVQHGDEQLLTPTQIVAMLYTKLRQISGNPVDCVINCPNYFDFLQRRALLDAAQIAGLNPLRVISDMTAVALYYGFYRSSPTGSDISIVGFVDCGQTSSQAAMVLFNHKDNYLKVLDAEFLADVGGRHFDEALANYFIEKHSLKLSERSRYRLIVECEKLKKNLSANPNELPINIECLYDEKDFNSRIDRATFEQISQNLFEKIASMLKMTYERSVERFIKEYQDNYGDFRLDSVEVVGGTSRIPAIKKMIKEFCGLEPSTTLNADEAVARGCALQCAILSPTFKVARELHLIDSLPFSVDFKYEIPGKDVKVIPAMIPRGHPFPCPKQITIPSQNLPITLSFYYDNLHQEKMFLAQYRISEPPGSNALQSMLEHKSPIKIRVRINANCTLSIGPATFSYENPQQTNEQQQDEPMEQQPQNNNNDSGDGQNKMETETQQQQTNDSQPQQKRKKPKTTTIDLLVEPLSIAGLLPKEVKDRFIEFESNLILADKNWKEKADARNALEEFIYEWRDRMESGDYDPFIDPATKQQFQQQLESNEKWLYEQDEKEVMHSKSVYDERTQMMAKSFADSVIMRRREFENRPRCLEQLGHHLQQARKIMETNDLNDDNDEKKKFFEEIEEKQHWFDDVSGKLASMRTYDDPPFTCDAIQSQSQQLDSSIQRIHNNRKRRAEERRKAAEKNAEKEKQQQQQQAQQEASGDKQQSPPMDQQEPAKMDVDPQPEQK
ncbi:heat shock protein 105 kDa [Dermatophagoides farinae]|nr:heat shock protein 105 kDa-like [Dermatophagoides farinae]KAH9516559.1 Heat shock 70 kDa protein 4L [Dermatophagoides farinae]QED58155.1 HSP70-1 [Dermatophagoides farinae]